MPSFLMNNNKKTVHFANFCWKKLGDFFLFVNYFCFPFFASSPAFDRTLFDFR